ncbi:hypothetical protein ES703_42463 [subsurface metagenome]
MIRRYHKRLTKKQALRQSRPKNRGYLIEDGVVWFFFGYDGTFNIGRCSWCRRHFHKGIEVVTLKKPQRGLYAYVCKHCVKIIGLHGSVVDGS